MQIYLSCPPGADIRELLALRYGLGAYRPHSYEQIGLVCQRSNKWARYNIKKILDGNGSLTFRLKIKLLEDSINSLFKSQERLTLHQTQQLADAIYAKQFSKMELQIIVGLYGLANQPCKTIDEINQQVFQGAGWGRDKILGLKHHLETSLFGTYI